MPIRRGTFLALSPALALSLAVSAQQPGRGSLTGTIVDPQGLALQGVRVSLSPSGASAQTNATGQYTISGVAAGQYTLTASYAGFADRATPITIIASQSVRGDATLQVTSSVSAVDVYAGREGGELEAINRTFNADNIINVLPSDVINSLPNANVADAIGRLPGVTLERDEGEGKYIKVRGTEPRLTSTTLDGVVIAGPETVRQIKLDLIPADLVESVQINKTLQANMEGAGIGGSVDLRTRSAEDKTTIYLDTTGGYVPEITGRSKYQFDGSIGQRFGPGHKFGALLSGSYDYSGEGINDVEPGPALAGAEDIRDYRYFRQRRGFGGTLDYKFSDTSSIYLKGLYSLFNNFGDDWIYTPAIGTFANATTLTQGNADGNVTFQALRRRPVQDIGGMQFGGHQLIHNALFNWDLNASVGRTRDNGYDNAAFAPFSPANPSNNVQYNINLSNPLEPHFDVQNGVNIYDPSKLFLYRINENNEYLPEVDLGFGGSLAVPFSLGSHHSMLEFGGRFRNEHKFENQNSIYLYPNQVVVNSPRSIVGSEDPNLALSQFPSNFTDPGYYESAYKFGPAAGFNSILAYSNVSDRGVTGGDNVGNSFNQLEKVSAGYVMDTTSFGKYTLNAGFRVEATGENNLGYFGNGSSSTSGAGKAPTHTQYTYLTPLPSASLRYALTPGSSIRFVYGRGLSRPNFSDLIPFMSPPPGGAARATISQGNPNLKAEFADDFDVLYDRLLPRQGLLQGGFFYKHFTNPIVPTQTLEPANPAVSGNTLPYLLSQTINAGSAHVLGLEIAYQQHFTFLPGFLRGFGVSANYAYTHSAANLPSYNPNPVVGTVNGTDRGPGGFSPALVGQAPNSWNFSPTYDLGRFSYRLGMTYNQANISQYNYDNQANSGPITQGGGGGGLHGPNGDVYFYSHLQVDMQASYRLMRGFQAIAYVQNATNEVFGFYQGSTQYPIQREFYQPTLGGGLRWNPTSDR